MKPSVKVDDSQHIEDHSNSSCGMIINLKRVRGILNDAIQDEFCLPLKRRLSIMEDSCTRDEENDISRAVRLKPWASFCDCERTLEDDSQELVVNDDLRQAGLPVGVVRGCPTCETCQKINARWRPETVCRPALDDAPVFFPLEEEFQDTLKYIASIAPEAEQYGICRIIPPHSWRPPCPLKDSEKRRMAKFRTRVQQIHKLQVREAEVKKTNLDGSPASSSCTGRNPSMVGDSKGAILDEDCKFGFEPGPNFTLESFERYAQQFEEEYFWLKDRKRVCNDSNAAKERPSVESIEGEYWRIVEHATEQIEVLYGADIEVRKFGSGFPKAQPGVEPTSYEKSGWNLNNIARLPGSVLSFEEAEISGVLVPWLYVGMCFSSFCWHVEDHHFYSLNYVHFGAPKVWYGVPRSAANKLENAMKEHLPDLFEEQPDLLHKLVTQLSPSILKAVGVPVYRAVQRAGEFIVTFPRAYHSGFNSGFNCAEAVNVAPVDWLPHGQNAIEMYKMQKRKSSVSHDKLLFGVAKHALGLLYKYLGTDPRADMRYWQYPYGQKEILVKSLKDRVDLERQRRADIEKSLCVRKMDKTFDAVVERECVVCHYDLHLSAVGCDCIAETYVCLEHIHDLCKCDMKRKYAMYRYDLSELDILVAALEGNDSVLLDLQRKLNLHGLYSQLRHMPLAGHMMETSTPASSGSIRPGMNVPVSFYPNQRSQTLGSTSDVACGVVEVIELSDDEADVGCLTVSMASQLQNNGLKGDLSEKVGLTTVTSVLPSQMTSANNLRSQGQFVRVSSQMTPNWHEAPLMQNFSCETVAQLPGQHLAGFRHNANGTLPKAIQSVDPFILQSQECYKVDLLNVGRLVLSRSWVSKDAIYPAGFCSRVLFPSFLNPAQLSFYISEVLDSGNPLFKVVMENHPGEVFVHPSIDRCWQMVQERVNMTINMHHHLGNSKFSFQLATEDIRGRDLFGFNSPHIIRAVEELDCQYRCVEYWASRTNVPARISTMELLENQHYTQMDSVKSITYTESSRNFTEPYTMMPFASQKIFKTASVSFNPVK